MKASLRKLTCPLPHQIFNFTEVCFIYCWGFRRATKKLQISHSQCHLMERLQYCKSPLAQTVIYQTFLESTPAAIITRKWHNLKSINTFKNKLEHRVENPLINRPKKMFFSIQDAVFIYVNEQKIKQK